MPCIKTMMEQLMGESHSITNDEFIQLQKDYELILRKIWINEKYNMILDNYYEIELEVLEAENRLMEIEDKKQMISIGQKYIVDLNRKLSNFLCSVRMYIDQTQHDLSSMNMELCTKEMFHQFTSCQYDLSIGFQIMELLRNYIQHQGLIIDGLTIIKPMIPKSQNEFIGLIIEIDYKKLRSIDKYSKKIKLDLMLKNTCSKKFNIMWFLQEYVSGVISVHKQLCDKLDLILKESSLRIEKILQDKYNNIPKEIGVFCEENEFLLQYNYIDQAAEKQRTLNSCFNERQIFKTTDRITGNFIKESIKYNMV